MTKEESQKWRRIAAMFRKPLSKRNPREAFITNCGLCFAAKCMEIEKPYSGTSGWLNQLKIRRASNGYIFPLGGVNDLKRAKIAMQISKL